VIGGLTQASAQKGVVLKGGKHGDIVAEGVQRNKKARLLRGGLVADAK
jgi:hypothetical protein